MQDPDSLSIIFTDATSAAHIELNLWCQNPVILIGLFVQQWFRLSLNSDVLPKQDPCSYYKTAAELQKLWNNSNS